MSVPSGPHITAIAGDAVHAMYRSTVPLRALIEAGTATGNVHVGLPHDLAIEAGAPLVVHAGLALPPALRDALRERGCRLVRDYDGPRGMLGTPAADRATRRLLEAEIERELSAADAVTAATEPLAQALRARGAAAVVLPSILDPRDWTARPPRAEHRRPRIGWLRIAAAGGDAGLVETVVRTLGAEADFVFFGHVPNVLADIADRLECRSPVPLALFAASLAACDLDLALAPLALDAAGEYAGNLLLLQAGILGYPVIATDSGAHRGLPVTRLPNIPARWIAALRERMPERAALRREGDVLRAAVVAGFTARVWARHYAASWSGARRQPVNV